MPDDSSTQGKEQKRSWSKRIWSFVIAVGLYLLFANVFTPMWVSHSKLHQDFMAAVDDLEVPVGVMYYNDLPFINDAAMIMYDTWRYLPREMADKKARAETQSKSK